ncbi:MAG: Spi family protease inhibitor [Bacteroidales bacterium]
MVATNFLIERTSGEYGDIIFTSDFVEYRNGLALYHVFNWQEGFIIVSACKFVYPVLGYSFKGAYSGENISPAFLSWLMHYQDQIEYSILNNVIAKPEYFESVAEIRVRKCIKT